jgi:hypothetical protein
MELRNFSWKIITVDKFCENLPKKNETQILSAMSWRQKITNFSPLALGKKMMKKATNWNNCVYSRHLAVSFVTKHSWPRERDLFSSFFLNTDYIKILANEKLD